MDKLNDILTKILGSIQVISNALLSLTFQPLFYLLAIIEGIIEVWTVDENNEYEEQPQVTQLPSTNAGRYTEEVDYPIGHIGFRQNHKTE